MKPFIIGFIIDQYVGKNITLYLNSTWVPIYQYSIRHYMTVVTLKKDIYIMIYDHKAFMVITNNHRYFKGI